MNEAVAAVVGKQGQYALEVVDIQELLPALPDGSVNCLFTDPPYDTESQWLYTYIYTESHRVLAQGGHLVMIVPQYCLDPYNSQLRAYLPEDWVPDQNFRLRWEINMNQEEGPHPRLVNSNRNIEVVHKSLLWWTKYPVRMPDYRNLRDSFDNKPLPVADRKHKWQQSETWAEFCVQLCNPFDVVLDPLMGTGTLPLVALRQTKLHLQVIGTDHDPEVVEIARQRIYDEVL